MANAKRDDNRIPVLLGTSSSDSVPTEVYVDPTTHRLHVDASITTGFGAQTGVTDGEAVDGADTGVLLMGTDGANYQLLSTDASGNLQVDIVSGGASGAQYTIGTDTYLEGTSIGTMAGAVRNDTLATLASLDNEIAPLQVNPEGALYIQPTAEGFEIAPSELNADGVSPGTGLQIQSNDYYYNGATWDRVRGDLTDGLLVNLGGNNDVTVSGTVLTNIQNTLYVLGDWDATHDSAVPTDGVQVMYEAKDHDFGAFPNAVSLEGDAVRPAASLSGVQYVMPVSEDGGNYATIITRPEHTLGNDEYSEGSTTGYTMGAVRNDTLGTLVSTDNEIAPLQVDSLGALYTQPVAGGFAIGYDELDSDGEYATVGLEVGAFLRVFNGSEWDRARGTSADGLLVDLGSNNDVSVTGTVTVDLGSNNDVQGGVAHDAADSGNPIKIGAKAYSPDGTTPGTAVAEGDRSDAKGDLDGRMFVNPVHPRHDHKHLDGSSAYTDTSLVAAPGAGFQVIITSIIVSTGAATALNFFLEESTTKIFGPIYLEATAGRGFVSGPIHLPVTANTAVTITTSAAIAQSVDVDYFIQAV